MVKLYDIPAEVMIEKIAEMLKNDPNIKPPEWSYFAKTGSHKERIPLDKDWWYTRCASLLRKVYIHGPIGLTDLKSYYGGWKQVGYNLAHHRDAGGSVIRKALQQLEVSGYIIKIDGKGRTITQEGMKKLDNLSKEIHADLVKVSPELKRYG